MGGHGIDYVIYDEAGPVPTVKCRWSKRAKIPRRLRKRGK